MISMKFKLMSVALLAANLSYGQITNPAPYCAAGYDDGFMAVGHYISKVTLGTLSNTTGSTQFAAPHYAYYNSITAPNLIKGNSYPISVTHDGGASIHFVAVYIDYNRNNSFGDAGELVLKQSIVANNVTNPSTATITIPATATAGVTRMRVMVFEDDDYTWGAGGTNSTPCTADASGSLDWGETEDYNVNITAGSSFSPVAAFNASTVSGTTSTNFTFTDASTNSPTTWKWTFTPNTVTYQSGTSGASAKPIVRFSKNGFYSVKLKVSNTSGADSLTKNNYITVGATGINEIRTTSIAVYPNPAKNYLYINDPKISSTIKKVSFYDLQGKSVLETVKGIDKGINVESLSAGTYILIIEAEGEMFNAKISIQK